MNDGWVYGGLCKAVKGDMWYYKPVFCLARCVVQFVYIFLILYIHYVDRGIEVNWESFLALFILCVIFNIISSFGFECSESLGLRFDRLYYICEVVWFIMPFILYALNIGLLDDFSMFVVFWFRSCAEIILVAILEVIVLIKRWCQVST